MPEPASTEPVGEVISYQNVSFMLDPALGVSAVTSETVPTNEQDDNHPFTMPEHIRFTFVSLPGDEPRVPHSMIVFPVNEYEAVAGDAAVEAINSLRILLDNRPNLSDQTALPQLPLTNIPLQIFPMQAEYIDFDGGAGIRYLEAWTHELFYEFQALSNDNQSYITARFPISIAAQIGDRPDGTLIDEQVNALEPDDFMPNLNLLDSLFRSLSIGETVSWDEAQALILSGQVQQVVQLHSLEVQLTLKDGRQVTTTEPNLDDVIRLIDQCGDNCRGIAVASE
jgi:hypothetical protein